MAISLLGDGIYYVAIAWQAYTLSDAPAAMSVIGIAWTAPTVLFLLIGGRLSDRRERRSVMVGAALVQGLAIGAVGVLALAGSLTLPLLIGLVALSGAAMGFFNPAFGAIVPGLVARQELAAASALEHAARPIALQLAGPALGGLLIATAGPGVAFLVDAGTFAVAAGMFSAMGRQVGGSPRSELRASADNRIASAWGFVRANRWLWMALAAAGLSQFIASGPSQVLVPFLLKNELHVGGGAFGLVRAVAGVGAIGAAVTIGQLGLPGQYLRVMFVAWALQALAGVGYGLAANEWGFALISLSGGVCGAVGNVIWGTLIKTRVPNELLGRVASLDWLISIGLVPLSFAITAPIVAALGLQLTLIVTGVLGAAVMLLGGLTCGGAGSDPAGAPEFRAQLSTPVVQS